MNHVVAVTPTVAPIASPATRIPFTVMNHYHLLSHILNIDPAPEGLKEYQEVGICRVPPIMALWDSCGQA
jgi:hypothetical protein